jgi:hypothetical protein
MDEFAYAEFGALQGQLQRGRGIGARRAPTVPNAADLVYECVVADSRWDRQTEQRDAHLARLIHRLDLDGQCTAEGLDDCEPSVQQAACTNAPDTAYVCARLAELSEDPLTPNSHEAANHGLTRLNGSGSAP